MDGGRFRYAEVAVRSEVATNGLKIIRYIFRSVYIELSESDSNNIRGSKGKKQK
jgi:hypothetical protein